MTKLSRCDTCGFMSENEDDVRQCEKQDKEVKYTVGQRVTFMFGIWVEGEIRHVAFGLGTHKVSYGILVGDTWRVNVERRNTIIANVPEEDIREGALVDFCT